ncbi:hypothetical protein O6H91_11G070200 [Diphasiastrum complanatum]|nr:hypothetical protein O6H91_11G070200 [Diphasiastrum complanatum]
MNSDDDVLEVAPDPLQGLEAFNWDPDATSFEDGAKKLKECVKKCCEDKFDMKGTPLGLAMGNVPNRFDEENKTVNGGCVQLDFDVKQIRSGEVKDTWHVMIDADPKSDKQKPHYGYTVYGTVSGKNIPKFTGHVWLPQNPSNFRPWDRDKGEKVYFADSRLGGKNETFELKGERQNQSRKG